MPKRSTLRLTKRIVERLKADGKDAIFWDRDLAGFGVRVHATGRKLYIVQSRGPAGLKRVTLGPVDGETIEARRREAAEVIDRIKRGEDPRPAPEPTVADLAERFLGNHVEVRCKPNTAKSYREVLHNHVLPTLGKKPVGNVVPEDVAALHHRLRDRPSVANLAVWVLSRMYVLAEAWGMAPPGGNPCRHARYYRNKSRERFLTPEEFRLLGAALRRFEAEGSMMPSAIAAVRLLMLTGCRSDEVLSLT
ncbi:MAG: integrase arm-type DNA-binding domain-containing protein, partial [Rhodospirillaceae bacterium]|nr:integrase arm-type DNA-binding domain-containing protein [Rhodospirillaceae bacterium]